MSLFACSIRTRRSLPEICSAIHARLPRFEFSIDGATAIATVEEASATLKLAPMNATRERVRNLTLELTFDDYAQMNGWNEVFEALHEPPAIRYADRYSFVSPLPLAECCARIARAFALPEFDVDYENDNAWGVSEDDIAVVHVSSSDSEDASTADASDYAIEVEVKAATPSELDDAWVETVWRRRWVAVLVEISRRVFDGERWHDRDAREDEP